MNKKVRDIQNSSVGKIEETVKCGPSIKSARRKLGLGQGKMCLLNDTKGYIIRIFDDIVKFFTNLYSTESSQATFIRSSDDRIQRLFL